MSSEQMEMEFEAWAIRNGYSVRKAASGRFEDYNTANAWKGFKAFFSSETFASVRDAIRMADRYVGHEGDDDELAQWNEAVKAMGSM